MKRLLILLVLGFSVVSANAESWEVIYSDDTVELFADMESINSEDEDGYHTAMIKGVYYANNELPRSSLEEVHTLMQFDCNSHFIRGRILSLTYENSQQDLSTIDEVQELQDFKNIQPNTSGMLIARKVCYQ